MNSSATARYARRPCPLCGSADEELVRSFDRICPGEKDLGFQSYYRELWRCRACGHFTNRHELDLDTLYAGSYNRSICGDRLRERFDAIMGLPPEASDNRRRKNRVVEFVERARRPRGRRLLDVGSGPAVFPAVMRDAGWACTALDPDPAAIAHARNLGLDAVLGEIGSVPLGGGYDLVSFNKVLEHLPQPAAGLRRALAALSDGGLAYVELPDGEAAVEDTPERQEFFLEHYHAFSAASLALLSSRAGFRAILIERLRDPSGKYTLAAFLEPCS